MLLLLLLVIAPIAEGGQEAMEGCANTLQCVQCEAFLRPGESSPCADPFNTTMTNETIKVVMCKSTQATFCVKWVRQLADGIYYRRDCLENLKFTLPPAAVCYQESRPGTGQICLCKAAHGSTEGGKEEVEEVVMIDKDPPKSPYCNSAYSLHVVFRVAQSLGIVILVSV